MVPGSLKPCLTPMVYRSRYGARLTLVFLEPPASGAVLIRFEDFEGGEWNGRVVLHERRGSGDREQFFTEGLDRPSAQLKWGTMEARPPGCDRDHFMHLELNESAAVEPRELIALFERQQAVGAGVQELPAAEAPKALES